MTVISFWRSRCTLPPQLLLPRCPHCDIRRLRSGTKGNQEPLARSEPTIGCIY
jgi:hypothetical protein